MTDLDLANIQADSTKNLAIDSDRLYQQEKQQPNNKNNSKKEDEYSTGKNVEKAK